MRRRWILLLSVGFFTAFLMWPSQEETLVAPSLRAEESGPAVKLVSPGVPLPRPKEVPSEPPPASKLAGSFDRLSLFLKDFDSETQREVRAKATLDYHGYEGKFEVRFLIPKSLRNERLNVPILATGITTSEQMLGYSGVDQSSTDESYEVRFSGLPMRSFVTKKTESEAPNDLSLLIFTLNPNRPTGSTPIHGHFHFELHEEPELIGRLDYAIQGVP